MSRLLIGYACPESLVAQATLAHFLGSVFIIMAQGCRSQALPNEDPATLGALGNHERRG